MVFKFLHYNQASQPYYVPGSVPVDKLCNGFTVKNDGNTIVFVNGAPLQPGDFKAFGGNYGEIYRGRIDLKFQNITPVQQTPVVNMATVTQKIYLGGDEYDFP